MVAAATANEPLSLSAQRALFGPRPRFRGFLHKWAFLASLPAGIALVTLASGTREIVNAATFALGASFMLFCSTIVHLRRWTAPQYEVLFKLDHTGIFVMIAACTSPVAALGMHGRPATALLISTWMLTALGIFQEWLPFHPPRGLVNTIFLSVAWVPIIVSPWMWRQAGADIVLLILLQGLVYTVGAIIVGSQKPDPWPETFGYHEIWHTLVVVAAVIHYYVLVLLLT